MKLLIDTQVFIWLTNGDSQLGSNTLQTLRDVSNQIYISYFSFFEMAIKAGIGKLHYDSSVLEDLPNMDIELVMPDVSLLRNYSIYNASNKDPFDNVLITVARNEGYILVTSDPKVLAVAVQDLSLLDAKK